VVFTLHGRCTAGRPGLVVEDPHWPEVAEDGTKDIAPVDERWPRFVALHEAERRAYGRARAPDLADVDLEAWVQARSQVDT
jgi:hypothetical protein